MLNYTLNDWIDLIIINQIDFVNHHHLNHKGKK